MKKIRSTIINGKEYSIKWTDLEQSYFLDTKKRKRYYTDTLGLIDYDTKTIYINPNQSKKEQFSTLIHELCHAYNPKWGEKRVLQFEQEFNDLLSKLDVKI